jgi:hypothetical protein
MRGSKSDLIIRQGPEENYRPELYIEAKDKSYAEILQLSLEKLLNQELNKLYPGVSLEQLDAGFWRLNIPNKYRIGHESHFGEVSRQFMEYLDEGRLPQWEIDQMLAKYYVTTKAVEKAVNARPD